MGDAATIPPESAFRVTHTCGAARRGELRTAHGVVQTPTFMPVGTQGAVKAVTGRDLRDAGAEMILGNTYHLYLRPGDRRIARLGGLHRFMGWDGPILTDSGGYQVFSLAGRRTVLEDGVRFRSHLDGSEHLLTPEGAVDIQARLGSDVAMVLDECLGHPAPHAEARAAVERTARWGRRGRDRFLDRRTRGAALPDAVNPAQAQFGIVQGSTYRDLREASLERTVAIGFDGYAIGGLAVGEGPERMLEILDATLPHMPSDAPRYLMGVGRPQDLVECVARGVDMFDCVIPTRHARTGVLYTDVGRIRISDRRYRNDAYPPDTRCDCATCTRFSRAYLHHLFHVGEILASSLATIHNLRWYVRFMERMRASIEAGSFAAFRAEVLDRYPMGTPAEAREDD